jgi:formylglycine-generating enzyme required for sulfatase activity
MKKFIFSTSKTKNILFLAVIMAISFLLTGYRNSGIVADSSANPHHPAEPEMIFVEGGTFWMGCTEEQENTCRSVEKPKHSVTLGSFHISKYPVTEKQWKLMMDGGSSRGDNYPVTSVRWEDAQTFIRRLNEATGKRYRLPTEAEWEYAARGGAKSRGYLYSGSNDLNSVGWFGDDNSHPVGKKQPNELGIYDMSGNVWEWCSDWFGAYTASAKSDPVGASTGSDRVIRGGGWDSTAARCRVSFRSWIAHGGRGNDLGFRVVLAN